METRLLIEDAIAYSSRSQQVRDILEQWVSESIYCPNCGHTLRKFKNNKPVADFYCTKCSEEYELKSKQGLMGKKIVDGAYSTMIERLKSSNHPNLFFLSYDRPTLGIRNFLTIPKYFFIPAIIEKRIPLNISAKRAGWIGCNIVLNNIPEFGKIFYIKNGIVLRKNDVLYHWRRTEFVRNTNDIESKGWMLDVIICVEGIKKDEFTLEEIYRYEDFLKGKHPNNNNIRTKIRQQLQFLRDRNVIDFVGRGKYRVSL